MKVERSKQIKLTEEVGKQNLNKESLSYLNKFKMHMELRELSKGTIKGYEGDLLSWFSYIYLFQDNKSTLEITEDDLVEYFYYCKTEGNNTKRIRRRMAPITMYYKFLRKKKLMVENPMEFIDRPRKDNFVITQTFLSKDQVQLMKEKLDEYGDIRLTTYAFLSLSTMARVTAIQNITWQQIDMENRMINDVLEKEGYIVTLHFSEQVREMLLDLKQYYQDKNIVCDHIFCVNYNGWKQISDLNNWAKRIGSMIGVTELHPHDFRHSGATLLKDAGMPLEDISKLLNHKSLDTTRQFYIKVNEKQIQQNKDKYEIKI